MKIVKLNTRDELNIYMNPMRQQLLRQLNISNVPMTPKMLADKLQISASGVQHHIKKLISLGLIELDHKEMIRGITASYYIPTQVTVQIGLEKVDDYTSQREIIMQDSIARIYDGFRNQMKKRIDITTEGDIENLQKLGDAMTGVVHLNKQESDELMKMITDFIDTHAKSSTNSSPWEYAIVLYNAKEIGNE